MTRLIIAEKPSVARDIARVVGARQKRDGFLEGGGYLVSWAIGHLCNISSPEKQNPAWARWNLEALPMIPDRFRLEVLPKTKKQFSTLKKLLIDPQVTEVIEATDAGREGELIFRRIYQMARSKKPARRLWLSSMTDEAITRALAQMKPINDYNNLAAAAYARAESDWLVGMNETRAFTKKCGDLLTVGRVQTPVLAMLVKRRREIEDFVPQTYWEIEARFDQEDKKFKALWHEPPKFTNTRIFEPEKADQVQAKCQGHPALVDSITSKKGKTLPPLLYDLTMLQRTCNSRYGFAAQKTLSLAQDLYEKQKAITYPRTDSNYIGADVFKEIAARFRAVRAHYPELIASLRLCFEQNDSKYRVVNDKKVTDHHAIIPTEKQIDPARLTPDQRKVYDLVCRRFLAAFLPEAKYSATEAWLSIEQEKFKAKGKVFDQLGWLEAEPWAIGAENPLPVLVKGQTLTPLELLKIEKQTKPPAHFTDATILRAMETAGSQVEDEELAEAMKERGLGTPATRAQIIEGLLEEKRGYAFRQGKNIVATDKGVETVRIIGDLLPEALSPQLTGDWEFNLRQVEKGLLTYKEFIARIKEYVVASVDRIKQTEVKYQAPLPTEKDRGGKKGSKNTAPSVIGRCPVCGGEVVDTPKAFGCANWRTTGCKFAIWKTTYGGRITRQIAAELLKDGRTSAAQKLKSSKSNKEYQAKLEIKDGKVVPLFD